MLAQWISWSFREAHARREPVITLGSDPLHDSDFQSVVLGENRLNTAINVDIASDSSDVLGNHDYDRKSERNSGAPILPVNYFSRQIGCARIIALSDEMLEYRSHVTELGRNQDRWFKDVLDDAPDTPTIIMTHHCPLTGRRSVSAFEEWLADDIGRYNIVLWIVGHAHRWAIDEDLEGLGFDRIKVASLCRKHGDRRPCEGALLTIEAGQDRARITMRFRNHLRREWISVLGREAYELEVEA